MDFEGALALCLLVSMLSDSEFAGNLLLPAGHPRRGVGSGGGPSDPPARP